MGAVGRHSKHRNNTNDGGAHDDFDQSIAAQLIQCIRYDKRDGDLRKSGRETEPVDGTKYAKKEGDLSVRPNNPCPSELPAQAPRWAQPASASEHRQDAFMLPNIAACSALSRAG